MNVLKAMEIIHNRFENYIPCIATIAPVGSDRFFGRLLKIKDRFVDIQLQFSINSTDENIRDFIMPARKLSLEWIADYIERFYSHGKRKVVLNFAVDRKNLLDGKKLKDIFNPDKAIVKLTPINPTFSARKNNFDIYSSYNEIRQYLIELQREIELSGFETIISIGDLRENLVLSNCGQISMQRLKRHEGKLIG